MIFPTGPADRLETATLMFMAAINAAKERLWIASPYFVPDESIMNSLNLAGFDGKSGCRREASAFLVVGARPT